jgi:hypothetical protein
MDERRKHALITGLAVFATGCIAGFGAAELLRGARASVAAREERVATPGSRLASDRDRARDDDLALAVTELRRTMESLRSVLERELPAAAPPPDSGRVPVGQAFAPAEGAELATSLSALAAAIRTLAGRSGSSGVEPTLTAPGWVDRRAAFATDELRELSRAPDREEAREAGVRAFRSQHLFWTKQQVLSRYGKPDSIYTDDGFVKWCYQTSTPSDYEDVDFSFDDGVVVGVDYSYDWNE